MLRFNELKLHVLNFWRAREVSCPELARMMYRTVYRRTGASPAAPRQESGRAFSAAVKMRDQMSKAIQEQEDTINKQLHFIGTLHGIIILKNRGYA